MGLDTTHDCWHGAYSAFNRWRDALAELGGYPLKMTLTGRTAPAIDWDSITNENVFGEWQEIPTDPLLLLITHSDCEGRISGQHCAPLADRLEELFPSLPEGGGGGHIHSWRDKTRLFIDGLRMASEAQEDVEFR